MLKLVLLFLLLLLSVFTRKKISDIPAVVYVIRASAMFVYMYYWCFSVQQAAPYPPGGSVVIIAGG